MSRILILTRSPAAAVLCAMALILPGAALAQTAADVQCRKCVDKRDIAKKAVSKNRIREGAVTTDRLREAAVTPEKVALRIFDANDEAVGPVLISESGNVMVEVSSGAHAGELFFVEARRVGLSGNSVSYTLDDCRGQGYESSTIPPSRFTLPVEGWTGPDPALGADALGVAIRPVFFVPRSLDDDVETGLTFESRSQFDRDTGVHSCDTAISQQDSSGYPLDVVDDPELGGFAAPFRAGLE